MTTAGKALVVIAVAGGIVSLRAYIERFGATEVTAPENPLATTMIPHSDHVPRRGGLVLMNGDTHLEVIVSADGICRVYFSDAVRVALPPNHASEVTIGVVSRTGRREIALEMDPSQNVWIGRAEPIDDPNAIVRVSYKASGERPYWIDLPWPALRAVTAPAQATAE